MHDYDAVFRQPAWTSQEDPQAAHDQQVRKAFAAELVVMLREARQDYAAELVKAARTDGGWP